MHRTLIALVAAAAALFATAPASAVPPGLPYAGELLTPAGAPYTGSVDVTATLYAQEQGGSPIWGPTTFTGVDVANGTFVVVLDDATTPIAAALEGADAAWLAFSVKPDGTADWLPLEGRQQLLSVAYAHEAGDAARLGGTSATEFLTATEVGTDFPRRDELAAVATTGAYTDLAGKPDLAGYALTANLAGVCFSGSYHDLVDEPDLSVFVTLDALATVATSGSYGDLANRPDLAVYALATDLAVVAKTGQYADLLGAPDLGAYALVTALADVAMSGDYFDLLNAPDPDALLWRDGSRALTGDLDAAGHALRNVALDPGPTAPENPVIGQTWFDTTTQALKVYAESGWQSTGGGAVVLPSDGLSAVSNGTLTNVFTAGGASTDVPVDIPDNFPPGVTASLTIADSGTLRSLSVHVAITHPDASELKVTLTSPDGQNFVLHDHGPGTAGGLDAMWPPAAPIDGDVSSIAGSSPNGIWTLSVADAVYSGGTPGSVAGQLQAFDLTYEILRSHQVAVIGDVQVAGAVTAEALLGDISAASVGSSGVLADRLSDIDASIATHASDTAEIWGNGRDGDVVISSDTTLVADMEYHNLTLRDGVALNPDGYVVFVNGTLSIEGSGHIVRNGRSGGNGDNGSGSNVNSGEPGAGGLGLASRTAPGSQAGGSGGRGGYCASGERGVSPAITAHAIGTPGAIGGAGQRGNEINNTRCNSTGAVTVVGGEGAAGGTSNSYVSLPADSALAALRFLFAAILLDPCGSGGGGGGGAWSGGVNHDGYCQGGSGGGGGSSGGVIVVVAKRAEFDSAPAFVARGGAGGRGGNGPCAGGAGGGGGGNGGHVILVTRDLAGVPQADLAPGLGGAGGSGLGATGESGANGQAGVLHIVRL